MIYKKRNYKTVVKVRNKFGGSLLRLTPLSLSLFCTLPFTTKLPFT